MQSYDFLKLYQDYKCKLQLGGDDQWSNILGGIDLIRRVEGKEAYGMTFTLLTTSEGKKMGKTQKGALWLDAEKTPPYDFYQYWRNVHDNDVIKCLRLLTFLPMSEIEELSKLKDEQINTAKKILAYEVTKLVHGEAEAIKAQKLAEALFEKAGDAADMPTTEIPSSELENGISVLDLLIRTGLVPSKGEGRRLISQGGIYIAENRMDSPDYLITAESFENNELIIRKGKKVFHKVIMK